MNKDKAKGFNAGMKLTKLMGMLLVGACRNAAHEILFAAIPIRLVLATLNHWYI